MRHGLSLYRRPETPSFFNFMEEVEDLFKSWPSLERSQDGMFTPEVDIDETDKQYLLSFDLPGMSEKDIKLSVTDRRLTVSGERRQELKDRKSHRVERTFGQFERSFTLPESVNSDQIQASFRDGVLEVSIPKAEKSQPKTIDIKVNRDRPQ